MNYALLTPMQISTPIAILAAQLLGASRSKRLIVLFFKPIGEKAGHRLHLDRKKYQSKQQTGATKGSQLRCWPLRSMDCVDAESACKASRMGVSGQPYGGGKVHAATGSIGLPVTIRCALRGVFIYQENNLVYPGLRAVLRFYRHRSYAALRSGFTQPLMATVRVQLSLLDSEAFLVSLEKRGKCHVLI